MTGSTASTFTADRLLGEACARNTSAELRFEAMDGSITACRTRLLKLANNRILADRPSTSSHGDPISPHCPIRVLILLNGVRYEFDSVIEEVNVIVQLNDRRRVMGVALHRPTDIRETQRREHFRVLLAARVPIRTIIAPCHPTTTEACAVDAERATGRLIDLSAGGTAVLIDYDGSVEIERNELYYMTFRLPGTEDEFLMSASACYTVPLPRVDGIRVGFAFRRWNGGSWDQDQRRIARFVAEQERRILRRWR